MTGTGVESVVVEPGPYLVEPIQADVLKALGMPNMVPAVVTHHIGGGSM